MAAKKRVHIGVPIPNPKPKKPTSIRMGKTMRTLDSQGNILRTAPFFMGAFSKIGIKKMIPHSALAKIRLSNHSKLSPGFMSKPNAGVIPKVSKDQTTILFVRPPSPPAMNTLNTFLITFTSTFSHFKVALHLLLRFCLRLFSYRLNNILPIISETYTTPIRTKFLYIPCLNDS